MREWIAVAVLGSVFHLAPAASPSATAQAVEIAYWQYFFEQRVDAMDTLIDLFEAENPGITVKHTYFPYADYPKVGSAVLDSAGPDVMQLYYGWVNDYVAAGALVALPSDLFPPAEIEDTFFDIVSAVKIDGKYWALPTAVRSLGLFINRQLFEDAGLDTAAPPETYREMIDTAQALTRRDASGNLLTAGLIAAPTSQDHHWWREVLIRQFGGQPYSDDGRTVAYDSPAGRQALETYIDIYTTDRVTDYGFMGDAHAGFAAGVAAMHIDGSFRFGAFDAEPGLDWVVAELPIMNGVRSNFASYWVNGVTIHATGEKREAAFRFLKFLTSDRVMQIWIDMVGELPARKSVALTERNRSDARFGPFIMGLAGAHTTDFVNEAAQRQIFIDMIDRILIEGASLDVSLTAAAAEEQKLLDDFYGSD